MAVAALVLGIVGLLISLFSVGLLGWLGAALCLVGVILGALGRKDLTKKGIATGGLVVSIIGLIIGIVLYIGCVIVGYSVGEALKDPGVRQEFNQQLQDAMESLE